MKTFERVDDRCGRSNVLMAARADNLTVLGIGVAAALLVMLTACDPAVGTPPSDGGGTGQPGAVKTLKLPQVADYS